MTDTELAYAAGILDGEGTVTISFDPQSGRAGKHTLYVSIGNSYEYLAQWLKLRFGGRIQRRTMKATQLGKVPMYYWGSSGPEALNFVRQVLPYMLIKRRQAELAIEFQSGPRVHGRQVDRAEFQRREAIRRHISTLNGGTRQLKQAVYEPRLDGRRRRWIAGPSGKNADQGILFH